MYERYNSSSFFPPINSRDSLLMSWRKWSKHCFTQIVSKGRKYSLIYLNSRFHVYIPANHACFIINACKLMHKEALKGLVIHLLRILSTNTYQRNILCLSNNLGSKNLFIRIHLRQSKMLKSYVLLHNAGWSLCKFSLFLQDVYIHQCRHAEQSGYHIHLLIQLDNASII